MSSENHTSLPRPLASGSGESSAESAELGSDPFHPSQPQTAGYIEPNSLALSWNLHQGRCLGVIGLLFIPYEEHNLPYAGNLQSAFETQVSEILSIIAAYRHRSPTLPDRLVKFVSVLKTQLTDTVSKKEAVRFILPAFSKAPAEGTKRKTLGSLLDKAEEIALQTLNGLAASIADVYEGGATVVFILDASVYWNLLQITDGDAFAYHQELQKLVTSLGLRFLDFVRPGTLAGIAPQEAQTVEEKNVQAMSRHYDTAFPGNHDAHDAYAALVALFFPSAILLLIHESNNVGKIAVDLFPPATNPDFITPWHGVDRRSTPPTPSHNWRHGDCLECVKRNVGHLCNKDKRQIRAKQTKTHYKDPNLAHSTLEEEADVEETAQILEHFVDNINTSGSAVWEPLSSAVAPDLPNGYWLTPDPRRTTNGP
ncbi:uncharacterized protein ATNIH1004_006660 [Aspergillus tanneri]|uniref:Uncharacterized protein n=1 Tax=Aspergillus tanneri TaxID=1220188 RepID=A0A5M9ME80_9EURO|nr:uncharacterized protein ATNIH1004_006660 [Aspergillus tanneri]KAA8645241.1 hypothetical protein ATNIH1004_006660 [Aspergillus tanneri]